jgi:putative redox protein
MSEVQIESTHDLQQAITARGHRFVADEPAGVGQDAGPTPYEFLLAALGGCTSMTLLMYARRKGIPLESVRIRLRDSRIHVADCADCESREGHITEIARDIELRGPLNTEQRNRLLEIAAKCPVHKTLAAEIKVRDRLVE